MSGDHEDGMRIDETFTEDGQLVVVALRVDDGELVLVTPDESVVLPPSALASVMRRFGAPLEPGEAVREVDVLVLGDRVRLRHVRHLARYDVIARDYLVYEAGDHEPLCALATTVAGALVHLSSAGRA